MKYLIVIINKWGEGGGGFVAFLKYVYVRPIPLMGKQNLFSKYNKLRKNRSMWPTQLLHKNTSPCLKSKRWIWMFLHKSRWPQRMYSNKLCLQMQITREISFDQTIQEMGGSQTSVPGRVLFPVQLVQLPTIGVFHIFVKQIISRKWALIQRKLLS